MVPSFGPGTRSKHVQIHTATSRNPDEPGSSKRANQTLSFSETTFFTGFYLPGVTAAYPSQHLSFWVHEMPHHQVDVDDGAQVQGPVEEAVAHKLRDERPQDGEGEALR